MNDKYSFSVIANGDIVISRRGREVARTLVGSIRAQEVNAKDIVHDLNILEHLRSFAVDGKLTIASIPNWGEVIVAAHVIDVD